VSEDHPHPGGQFRGHQWAETVAINGLFRDRLWAVFHGRGQAWASASVTERSTTGTC